MLYLQWLFLRTVPPEVCRDQAARELSPVASEHNGGLAVKFKLFLCRILHALEIKIEGKLIWLFSAVEHGQYLQMYSLYPLQWREINMGIGCIAGGRTNSSRVRCWHVTCTTIRIELRCGHMLTFDRLFLSNAFYTKKFSYTRFNSNGIIRVHSVICIYCIDRMCHTDTYMCKSVDFTLANVLWFIPLGKFWLKEIKHT